MTKSISSTLTTALANPMVFTAMLLEITRTDGAVFRLTNHDQDINFGGNAYDHTTPFTVGAITHGSQLAVDNCEITTATTTSIFDLNEWKAGLFQRAKVTIRIVNVQDLTDGDVIMHSGWIGAIDINELEHVQFTVYGLLKIMDFEVGRVYQPSCDADFGDSRCKIALDPSQAYSSFNRYHVGEWVYYYDKTVMTTLNPVNPSFEADGARNNSQAITGWARSDVNDMTVALTKGALSPTQGSYLLAGGVGTGTGTGRLEQTLTQSVSLTGAGISTADLDAGKISVYYSAILAQTPNLGDAVEISIEVLNASGQIIDRKETAYKDLDLVATWRERALVLPLLSGARTLRIRIGMYRTSGTETAAAVDLIELYYWDHTATDPNDGVIHQVRRIKPNPAVDFTFPTNHSFEADGALSNSNSAAITGWTRNSATDYFAVSTTAGATDAPYGDYALVGGDDSSGVQSTYSIYNAVDLVATLGLDSALIDLDRYVLDLSWTGVFGDATSALKVEVAWYTAAPALISQETVQDFTTPGAAGTESYEGFLSVPSTARTMRIIVTMRSPVGDSDASNVGIDRVRCAVLDAERPVKSDPIYGSPGSGTTFATDAAALTSDGDIVWKARALMRNFDIVASSGSTKQFVATNLSGVEEQFIGSRIRWISGANAGQVNLVRIYEEGTNTVTLYFDSLASITSGDRFVYEFACQKRFVEDCVTLYDNGINFRGFPYLPGKFK